MKNIIKILFCVLAIGSLYIVSNTVSGDGITIDAIRYNGEKAKLVSALENEDYEKTAGYMSFYGCEDTRQARSDWAEAMENSGIAFEKIKRRNLYTDDGITLCRADATLQDGTEISFGIVVQDGGLSISTVHTENDREYYSTLLTTYYPG